MYSGCFDRFGVVGRMACILAAALLACASSAHSQVIEEGGFPVKGGDNSGEPFSLSCPSRLVVQAGSSIVLSCSATAVPEEGVRYEWEPVSVGGLDFLSAPDELSPLFMAPSSGAGEKYAYRLTATAPGVYETADVTVSVEGFSGDSAHDRGEGSAGPGVCDTFAFEGYREGCFSKGEGSELFSPFGGFSGEEGGSGFPFPGSPGAPEEGLPGLLGVGDPAQQTAPYLDCPPAVFLEELEVGSIECHVSDALGEEFLEYMWEPVGSTTRDYLDNPRLIPEDAPNPSVVAPEAPVYETLESFRSGETTFRYRYRLTATSRATGLSSSSEVEVFVSSSRPSVYCPLEVVIEEGATIALDCEGVDPLSGRMDYDEDGASIEWEWSGLWGTSTTLLDGTDLSSPLFTAPRGSAGKEYHYIASMTSSSSGAPRTARRKVTVRVVREGQAMADASAPGAKAIAPSITCEDAEIYEATGDFTLDCTAQDGPDGATYIWTGTDISNRLSGTDSIAPTFLVPGDIDELDEANKEYYYTVKIMVGGVEQASEDVTVTVKEKPNIRCARSNLGYEGTIPPGGSHRFDPCPGGFRGAPAGSDYVFTWTGVRTAVLAPEDALAQLDRTNVASPVFTAPTVSPYINFRLFYTYRLTVSAENADPVTLTRIGVSVVVQNRPELSITCSDNSYEVDEGDPDFDLDCEASGAWPRFTYTWQWSPIANLTGHNTGTPTFNVPGDVDGDTTYAYTVRVSAGGHHPDEATVEVTVLNKAALSVICTDTSPEVYEGSEDIELDCEASGAPGDAPQYTYVWTARGDTPDTALLSATDVASPAFHVPDEVDANETYEYLLTVYADNAEDATAEVTVMVLDRVQTPPSDPVSPPVDSPPLASSSAREPSDPSALGVTVSASSLRFGVQSADTEASLDPMTDQISTRVSGPYHAGRMTLSPDGGEALDGNGEMDLSIELASPVVLRREGGIEAASIVLAPQWSLAESCEQLSSQTIGGLYTETTLSDADCRLLRFGGELDLTDVPSGRYMGNLDIILRSGESEETHSVEVDVTVIPAQQVITIGPGGVRFSTSRELPAGLTEEQNLSIYPHIAFLTKEQPHGVFELSNPSLIPLEISVSTRFGYTEATENGREVVVEDASGSHLGDLSQVVDIHPGALVLQPGEKGLVRYGVQEGALAAMADKGYAAFFDVVSEPRQYVRSDRMPEEVTGEKTARVTMRVPGVYVRDEGASQLRATLLSISFVGSMSATFLVETQDRPFVGEVAAYDDEGHELGRRETLVYTRSRVRVPLDRMPEEGTVFLRFAPWGGLQAPEAVSVPWEAPRRDIGGAEDKVKKPTNVAIVRKP